MFLILNIWLWFQVYFTVCFKAEQQDYRELNMDTVHWYTYMSPYTWPVYDLGWLPWNVYGEWLYGMWLHQHLRNHEYPYMVCDYITLNSILLYW